MNKPHKELLEHPLWKGSIEEMGLRFNPAGFNEDYIKDKLEKWKHFDDLTPLEKSYLKELEKLL